MQEFIKKLIGRLKEEGFEYHRNNKFAKVIGIDLAISIVNELAEKCKNTNIITDFLQYARDNADNYDTNEGWSLADLIDLSIKFTEEYSANTPQNSAANPTTNADKIRSMTDEELAELFTKLAWNSEVQTTPLKYLEWLQSEVEGVTENE